MVDVSGIPNMGFGGGGYFGGNAATGQPAMSAAQINAGMWGNYSPQQAQATQAGIYGPGGFGAQPAYYAGLGAAYGRQTGYYGDTSGLPPGQVTPAAQAAAVDPWAGTGFDPIQYLHNNPDVAGATGGDPMKAYEHARSYGVNEGRGGTDMFNPGESWSPPQEHINQGFDAYPSWSPQSQIYGPTDFSGASKGINNPMNRIDWGQAFGDNSPALKDTLRQWGAESGGRYDPDLDRLSGAAWSYLNDPQNTDLRGAFGTDVFQAAQHAQQYGKPEGRNLYGLPGGIGSDVARSASEQYFQANPDVAAWAGGDPAKAWEHYRDYGEGEKREGFGMQGRDAIAQAVQAQAGVKNPYAGMILGPGGNPSYFNPGTYAGDQGNYGIPYNQTKQPGDIGFSPQSPMPNLGYNPGMANSFANPGMNANQFQNRFGMGFPMQGTPSQVMPGYGESLTPMDVYSAPHRGFGGSAETGGGGA